MTSAVVERTVSGVVVSGREQRECVFRGESVCEITALVLFKHFQVVLNTIKPQNSGCFVGRKVHTSCRKGLIWAAEIAEGFFTSNDSNPNGDGRLLDLE